MAFYTTGFTATENPISESGIWAAGPGTLANIQTTGGLAQGSATATDCAAVLKTPALGANQYARGTRTNATNGEAGPGGRIQSATDGSGYYLFARTAQIALYRYDDPTGFTQLGATFGTMVAGDIVEVEIDGVGLLRNPIVNED